MTLANDESAPKTISVPTAGQRYFGIAKNASYAAAARGEIPTIRIGNRLRVPVCQLEQMLQGGKKNEPAQ
jgi:hypothetical protein